MKYIFRLTRYRSSWSSVVFFCVFSGAEFCFPKYPFKGFQYTKGLVYVHVSVRSVEKKFLCKTLNFSGGPSLKLRKTILMRSFLSMMVST